MATEPTIQATLDATSRAVESAQRKLLDEHLTTPQIAEGLVALRQELAALPTVDKDIRKAVTERLAYFSHPAWPDVEPIMVRRLAKDGHDRAAGTLRRLSNLPGEITRMIESIEGRRPDFFKHFPVSVVVDEDLHRMRPLFGVTRGLRSVPADLAALVAEIERCQPRAPEGMKLPSYALPTPPEDDLGPLGKQTHATRRVDALGEVRQ